MTVPIGHIDYKAKKELISFTKTKDRKLFIRDVAILRIAIAMIETALVGEDFSGELKVLHKNKNRKEIKKANAYLDGLKKVLDKVHEKSSTKDIKAVFEISTKMFPTFINIATKYKGQVSLSHISLYLVQLRLNRENVHPSIVTINRTWGIARVTKLLEESGLYPSDIEKQIAKELNEKLKSF